MADVVTTQVAVRDLKTHLSQWLARARAGEVVEITSHRRPIARLTGYPQAEDASPSPLQQAIDSGIVSWNGRKPEFPPPVRLSGEGPSMSDLVLEGRN
jgi:prevent-host-death family protein